MYDPLKFFSGQFYSQDASQVSDYRKKGKIPNKAGNGKDKGSEALVLMFTNYSRSKSFRHGKTNVKCKTTLYSVNSYAQCICYFWQKKIGRVNIWKI